MDQRKQLDIEYIGATLITLVAFLVWLIFYSGENIRIFLIQLLTFFAATLRLLLSLIELGVAVGLIWWISTNLIAFFVALYVRIKRSD